MTVTMIMTGVLAVYTGDCSPGWVCAVALVSVSASLSVFDRKSTASCSISAGSRPATWFSRLNGTCPLTISVISSLGSSFISRLNTTSLLSFCGVPAAGLAAVVIVSLVLEAAVDGVDACVVMTAADLSLTWYKQTNRCQHRLVQNITCCDVVQLEALQVTSMWQNS